MPTEATQKTNPDHFQEDQPRILSSPLGTTSTTSRNHSTLNPNPKPPLIPDRSRPSPEDHSEDHSKTTPEDQPSITLDPRPRQ